MEKQNKAVRRFIFITEAILQCYLFYPWIRIAGKAYNAITYFAKIILPGSITEGVRQSFAGSELLASYDEAGIRQAAMATLIIVVASLVVQLLCLLHLILILFNRNVMLLNTIALVGGVVLIYCEYLGAPFDGLLPLIYRGILLLLLLIEFIGVKLIESWQEMNEQHREIQERDRRAKEERKRRLAFPGKYSRRFYRILWKNFRAGGKDYAILISSGALATAFIFAGIGIAEVLSPLNPDGSVLRGHGISMILLNFLVISLLISVFLVASALSAYLRKRMQNYGMFVSLGMRKKVLYMVLGAEIAGCMLLSVVGGLIAGNVVCFLACTVIKKISGVGDAMGNVSGMAYPGTFLLVLAIFGVSVLAVHDLYISTQVSKSRFREAEKEKMPGRFRIVLLAAGIVIAAAGILQFSKRGNAEAIYSVLILFAGLYLIVKNGWGILLIERKKRSKKKYYGTLVRRNSFYHRYRTTVRYCFLIGVVHIAALFLFSKEMVSSIIAEEPETLFPYDYMCMATEEDDDFFESLKNKYDVETESYPMVRVSNVDNTESRESGGDNLKTILPQGQHIGISESTYYELCERTGTQAEKLNLSEDGSDIYIIYQQDKSIRAHPLDYFGERKEPLLHIGQPVESYDYRFREQIFPKRNIVGSETGSLVGAYRRGEYENIVVFSDTYFEEVRDDWKTTCYIDGMEVSGEEAVEGETVHHWPTRLVLMNVADEASEAVEKDLLAFKKNHAFDEKIDNEVLAYYSSKTQIGQMKSDRLMTITVNMLIICALFLMNLFIIYLKFESEVEDKKKRRDFLLCIGMKRKERERVLKTEVRIFLWIPFLMAAVIVPVLTKIVWTLRQYTAEDCISCLKWMAVLAGAYIVLQIAGLRLIEAHVIRKVEGKNERNRARK